MKVLIIVTLFMTNAFAAKTISYYQQNYNEDSCMVLLSEDDTGFTSIDLTSETRGFWPFDYNDKAIAKINLRNDVPKYYLEDDDWNSLCSEGAEVSLIENTNKSIILECNDESDTSLSIAFNEDRSRIESIVFLSDEHSSINCSHLNLTLTESPNR